jgi:acetolactate synthase-1/2/3 large subunit
MESDLVFFIGSATGSQVTDGWRLPAMGSPVIQLDIDPERLGKHYPNQVSICADAKIGLRELIDAATPGPDRREWCETVAGFVKEWRAQSRDFRTSGARPIRPERIAEEITNTLPDNGILLSDTGHSGIWTASMVDMRPGQSFLRCAGSLGWAFPAAIGAAMAAPDRPVVCFTGDGGLYYHLGELETAARYNANVTIVVNNNVALSQNTRSFRFAFDNKPTDTSDLMWKFSDTDLTKVAEALGCRAIKVEDPARIAPALKEAMAIKGPVILDVQADSEALAEPAYGGTDFYGNVSAKTPKK